MGWAIATLGLSQSSFFALGDRYHQALAEPTRRQRALLIGINQYPETVGDFAPIKGTALAGCLTDVELQRELLIHRFGFAPGDILVLTDERATRQAIEDAIQSHLLDPARSGDRLLFHFSGLGSQGRLLSTNLTVKTLVPVDGLLPTEEHPTFNDIQFETLHALLQALPSENITTVLDAAFLERGTPLQGNFRVRSRPSVPSGRLNPAEQALQDRLVKPNAPKDLPGLYLGAAAVGQPALEGQWSGFSAGVLTYALTQYLWEVAPSKTIQTVFPRLANRVYQAVDGMQTPVLEQRRSVDSVYTMKPTQPGSQGVVWGVSADGSVQVWLGGVPPQVLECYGDGSVVVAGPRAIPLMGRSRTGLLLRTELANASVSTGADLVGLPVQESIRLIPRNLGLTIALDPSLERIERVDATSAFAAAKVNVVAAGEQSADLLFGKATAATLTASSDVNTPPPVLKSYGLFYPPRVAVPGTLATADEAVKTAVNRLAAKLPRLLAIKYLSLTENITTSQLALRVTLENTDTSPQIITQLKTPISPSDKALPLPEDLPTVPMGAAIQCRIQNQGDNPLNLLWVPLSQVSRPLNLGMLPDDLLDMPMVAIAPGETHTLPQAILKKGPVDIFLIASAKPFDQTTALVQSQQAAANATNPVQTSLNRVQAILQDLSQPNSPTDAYALAVSQWATLRLRYRVV